MRWHEVIGLTEDEWLATLSEVTVNNAFVDAQARQAEQLLQRGRVQKKRAQLAKAEQEASKRRSELSAANAKAMARQQRSR